MNREILFKAKRVDNGEWEIGSLIELPNGEHEIANKCQNPPDSDPMWNKCVITHKIDPSTICQCTGLKDKNGKLIWENDIVSCQEGENFGQINWNESEAGFYFDILLNAGHFCEESIDDHLYCMEVIGNIFDNPELLEGGAEE